MSADPALYSKVRNIKQEWVSGSVQNRAHGRAGISEVPVYDAGWAMGEARPAPRDTARDRVNSDCDTLRGFCQLLGHCAGTAPWQSVGLVDALPREQQLRAAEQSFRARPLVC